MTASVLRVCARRRTWTTIQLLGLVFFAAAAVVAFIPGHAEAQSGPSVTIASGPFIDGQTITVSGTGFPTRSEDASGLQIIECSDPDGLPANLPQDDSSCDATSADPLPVLTDSTGAFSTTYSVVYLETAFNSAINCDQSNDCVLWVGEDYVNQFQSNFAFSSAFLINPSSTTSTTVAGTTTTTEAGTTTTTEAGTTTTTEAGTTTTTEAGTTTTTEAGTTTTTEAGTTTTTSSTTTTEAGTTTTTSSTTTTSPGTTTTGAGTTTSSPAAVTTTSSPATGTGGGTTPTGGTGSGASSVAASGGQLALTGPPTALTLLLGFGAILIVVGALGRRLLSSPAP